VNPALFSPAGKERWAICGPVMILFVSVAGDRSVGW
jgi:hypothetical protein